WRAVRRDLGLLGRSRWSTPPTEVAPRRRPSQRPLADWAHRNLTRPVVSVGAALDVAGASGLDGLPGPLLLVANHQHTRDAELLMAALPADLAARCRVLGLRQVAAWNRVATVPGLQGVTADRRQVWAVFPEGAPSTDGRVGSFDPRVVRLAGRTGAVVVPVGIRGSFALPGRGESFPGVLAGDVRRVAVRFGEPLRPVDGPDETAAQAIREAVQRLLDEDVRTWWDQLRSPAPAEAEVPTWRRVWSATAPAEEGGSGRRRRIWR
ncbi:lysophospholipid acyltransferase family protein, partial [Desertihabitans aurantiacus]|uniref:lysophospholipid acyltransferase family protein n=1 Tax=Desertihabitans aurantiacus TaxID=2282477 RepID=UPI000DF725CB